VGGLLVAFAGEILEAFEAVDLEEFAGGGIEDGSAEGVVTAGDFDEALFHEESEGFAAVDAADGFDVGAGERLLVGDDGEGFAGRAGEAEFLVAAAKRGEPAMEFAAGEQLKTAGDFFDLKRGIVGDEEVLQFSDGAASGGDVGEAGGGGDLPRGQRLVSQKQDRFDGRHDAVAGQGIPRLRVRRFVRRLTKRD
jgi:hypothetical protein